MMVTNMNAHNNLFDLHRFLDTQERIYERALAELRGANKGYSDYLYYYSGDSEKKEAEIKDASV
jgi:uncharacterized protein (DUF1810 family)